MPPSVNFPRAAWEKGCSFLTETPPTQTSKPATSPTDFLEERPGGQRFNVRGMLPSLILSAVLPFVTYRVLSAQGIDDVRALTASAIFPLLETVFGLLRTRHADLIGVISLFFIVVGVITSVISGDARFILMKESFLTGLFGVACLFSLVLMPRPIMFFFGRQFAGGGDPARSAAFDNLWQYPSFRSVNRRMTLVWGCAYVLEAVARIVLTVALPISLFLIVSPVMALGVTIALVTWTMAYARRSAQRGAALQASMQSLKA